MISLLVFMNLNLDSIERLRRYMPYCVAERPIWRHRAILINLGMLALIGLTALLAPHIAPVSPGAITTEPLQAPNYKHWLGSDHLGRDVFSRLLHGGRWTLRAALLASLISAVPGALLGLIAGFYGNLLDSAISRALDVQLAFPRLLFAMGVVALTGRGLTNIALATGLSGLPTVVRIVRGATRSMRDAPYMEASRALGVGDWRLIRYHLLPNIIGTVLVVSTLQMGWAILDVAALSFLGLGPDLGTAEWGAMLFQERGYLRSAPWAALSPGLALGLTVLLTNLLGDALRDALDPLNSTRANTSP